MKRWEEKIVPGGLAAAGLLFLVGAFTPAFAGSPLNVTFLLIGLVCAAFAAVAWRRSRGAP